MMKMAETESQMQVREALRIYLQEPIQGIKECRTAECMLKTEMQFLLHWDDEIR